MILASYFPDTVKHSTKLAEGPAVFELLDAGDKHSMRRKPGYLNRSIQFRAGVNGFLQSDQVLLQDRVDILNLIITAHLIVPLVVSSNVFFRKWLYVPMLWRHVHIE